MSADAQIDFDWRAIRIAEVRADGFVAFDFFVGAPDIYAEMLLGPDAFREFCTAQGVEPTGPITQDATPDALGLTLREAARLAANLTPPVAVGASRPSNSQGANHAA